MNIQRFDDMIGKFRIYKVVLCFSEAMKESAPMQAVDLKPYRNINIYQKTACVFVFTRIKHHVFYMFLYFQNLIFQQERNTKASMKA